MESVNLMEWLRTDMSTLAVSVAKDAPALASALTEAAEKMRGLGVTGRLKIAGKSLAPVVQGNVALLEQLARHRSDIVRQWACYAVNDPGVQKPVARRLDETLRFADDSNMSVRETAWMAFRPHLPAQPEQMIRLLLPLVSSPSENIRRFAIEVTRPRSVWGAHLPVFKRDPGLAAELLDEVMTDSSRYVRLAVGNWLNDAAKTRPDWVEAYCARWNMCDHKHTRHITKRGSRTISAMRTAAVGDCLPGMASGEAA